MVPHAFIWGMQDDNTREVLRMHEYAYWQCRRVLEESRELGFKSTEEEAREDRDEG